MMNTLTGKITIARYMNISEEDKYREICIEITDQLSGATFLQVYMNLENFAKAIIGQGYIPMIFQLRGVELVGKKREYCHVVIETNDYPSMLSETMIDNLLKPYEVDGWVGDRSCFKNHHNFEPGNKVRVNFERFVESK